MSWRGAACHIGSCAMFRRQMAGADTACTAVTAEDSTRQTLRETEAHVLGGGGGAAYGAPCSGSYAVYCGRTSGLPTAPEYSHL